MQTIRRISTSSSGIAEETGQGPGRDLLPLLAGAATVVGAVGAILAFADVDSPLRGPLTLFFLLAAPSAAIVAALRGLEPFGRVLASVAGGVTVNMLVAQGMLALHQWSVPGGIAAVTAISTLILLLVLVRRPRGRASSGRAS
ncbi:hypothetical protein [Streptomyces sp. NBC_00038]|uniref:hypothetical protein n=1 Tax=Streptomyces sp. NBC_00038 TaxID=2903615 RepID=UPI00225969B4|nr:hypothetical protein [Streptomyces sp. NBC_00038]MCX5556485.1 hypothetical protein [Streptomyces sp. NBC_00038]